MKIAIIGGGWAGLAAAVELSSAGHPPTVYEAGRTLGGRARSVDLGQHQLDNGQHLLIGAYHETLRLMRQVGADPGQLLRRTPLSLVFPGQFALSLPAWPAPWHLAAGLLGARGLTLAERWQATRFMQALKSSAFRLVTDCSVTELLDAHGQSGNLRRYLWEPLCLAALNTPPQSASAQIFANTLRDSLGGKRHDTDLLLPLAPLGRLFPEPAAAYITAHGGSIVLGERIGRFEAESTTAQAGWKIGNTCYSHIIIAVAPQHAARLLVPHHALDPVVQILADTEYEPIITAYLGYPDGTQLPQAMLGLSNGTGQWLFDRGQLDGAKGVISAVLSGPGPWEREDDASLVAALHQELARIIPELPPPHWQQVIRERRATFSCRPGMLRPNAQTNCPGLWLAGDYVYSGYPATLEAAMRSGVAAARGLLAQAG